MNKPRNNQILHNSNQILHKKGFLEVYLRIVFILTYLVFTVLLYVLYLLNNWIAFIINLIVLLCVIFVHYKLRKFSLAIKNMSAYEIVYGGKYGNRPINDKENTEPDGSRIGQADERVKQQPSSVSEFIKRGNR